MNDTDNGVVAATEPQQSTPSFNGISLEHLQALAFGEPLPAEPQQSQDIPSGAPQAATTNDEPQPTIHPPAQPFDPKTFLKEKLGYESPDEIKAIIEEYNKIKNNPPQKAELDFANDESKKIYQYLKEGKSKEVKQYLEAQELLSNLDAMSAEQQLRLHIQMNNPLFDPELIDDEYSERYTVDESKFKNEDGTVIDATGLRKAKVKVQQKIQSDVAAAQEYFSQYKQKINLPDITPNVDEDYQAYQASTAKAKEEYDNITVPAVNALKEDDVKWNFRVDDKSNKMEFDLSIVPSKEDFEEAKKQSLNFGGLIQESFYDATGKFQPQKLAQAVSLWKNFGKYAQSIARQAVNAERARIVSANTTGSSTQRTTEVNEPNEQLQKLEQLVFGS